MFAPVARLVRNQLSESWHLGAAAVARPGGELVARIGDPQLPVYLRSSAKPFQIQPLLAADGEKRFALDDADLALICASHSGTEEHAARALSLLERGGFTVADLLCGAHPPLDPEVAAALAARGPVAGTPTPLHNNCSGKHAGMLLACRALGLPTTDYIDLAHPLQRQILAVLTAVTGLEEREIQAGVDGCSAPAFYLSLAAGAAMRRGPAAAAAVVAAVVVGSNLLPESVNILGRSPATRWRLAGLGSVGVALIWWDTRDRAGRHLALRPRRSGQKC